MFMEVVMWDFWQSLLFIYLFLINYLFGCAGHVGSLVAACRIFLFIFFSLVSTSGMFGEGNGTPLQYSCLENPMDGGAWWAAVHEVQESDTTEWLHFDFSLSCIGERNGNPLQYSCLENQRDGGAWWAAIYGVAQSQTRLSDLAAADIHRLDLKAHTCGTLEVASFSLQGQVSFPAFLTRP